MTSNANPPSADASEPDSLYQQATAYVFDELVGQELSDFELRLQTSGDLRAIVESIRETVGALESEFESETLGVHEADRERIETAMSVASDLKAVAEPQLESKRSWLVGMVLAASVFLLAGLSLVARNDQGATISNSNVLPSNGLAGDSTTDSAIATAATVGANANTSSSMESDPYALSDGDDRGSAPSPELHDQMVDFLSPSQGDVEIDSTRELLDDHFDLPHRMSGRSLEAGSVESQSHRAPVGSEVAGMYEASDIELPPELAPLRLDVAAVDGGLAPSDLQLGGYIAGEMGPGATLGGNADEYKGGTDDGSRGRRRTITSGDRMGEARVARGSSAAKDAAFAPPATPRRAFNRPTPRNPTPGYKVPSSSLPSIPSLSNSSSSIPAPSNSAPSNPVAGPPTLYPEQESLSVFVKESGSRASRVAVPLSQKTRTKAAASDVTLLRTRLSRNESVESDGGRHSDLGSLVEQLVPGDRFAAVQDNPFVPVDNEPLSTFSIDVDTASYSKVRMYLMQHQQMPSTNAIRIEELVNYFDYDYESPKGEHPFSAAMQVATCPWNAKHQLARIGIKGKEIETQRPSSNLVFLLDVSGSMNRPNKLPLVIDGMKKMVNQLTENDSVAIVVYAGAAGLVLGSTPGDQRKTIIDSLERLSAGGSTAGAQGIQRAYEVARDNFITGGTNRVILCTDGDFNVGVSDTDALVELAAENAKGNIFLSVLGYGSGNHNDAMMEAVSNRANGNYAFIDTADESQKVLVDQMQGTLVTIAKDVKIQVEFNPTLVSSYRLIGYENRVMAAKDFADDTKDAGEIGAGHTVTALYELVPAGRGSDKGSDADSAANEGEASNQDLKYQRRLIELSDRAKSDELLTLKLRYKQPTGTKSTLVEFPIKKSDKTFSEADQDFQFAASVASFGMLLRNSPHKGDANFDSVEELAVAGAQGDTVGYRTEFVQMVKRAAELSKAK